MKSDPIPSSFFSRNRDKLGRILPEGSIAVVVSNPSMVRSGDQFFPYRQNSDFFYLTGIEQEGSVLVITPSGPVLILKKPDLKTDLWSGPSLTRKKAYDLSGISDIRWTDKLDRFLGEVVTGAKSVHINHIPGVRLPLGKSDTALQLKDIMVRMFPEAELVSLSPLMVRLRMIKEKEEVEQIRKASTVTRAAFMRIVTRLKPGMCEYELEAELTAEVISGGARGHAFEPILACGKNALVLHYSENSSLCRAGDMLLMDFGAEINNYAADCTRTLPVSGKFSRRQREIYDAVYRIFLQARSMMVPGQVMGDFHNKVGELWVEEHIRLGLYTRQKATSRTGSEPLWKKYFVHGTSHSLGLDVHDPFDRSEPFQEGMIFTCEPAIYIPGEGIGIRLENDILITGNGPVDLMEDIPIEAEEIEEIMQKRHKYD